MKSFLRDFGSIFRTFQSLFTYLEKWRRYLFFVKFSRIIFGRIPTHVFSVDLWKMGKFFDGEVRFDFQSSISLPFPHSLTLIIDENIR